MRSYSRTSVSDFLGDRIVYRDLQPFEQSLPRIEEICRQTGIKENPIPRKHQLDYARVILHLLQTCCELDRPGGRIERLVFIGDTRLLDGTAFTNLCRVSGLPGLAFIASEDRTPASLKLAADSGDTPVYLSNRWALLSEFDQMCDALGQPVGQGTAVVIDLDKTAIGARGRNGRVIDQARMRAVEQTVAESLGMSFDREKFRSIYEPLNQPDYHFFTEDNQDYLAYICLIVSSGMISYDDLLKKLRELVWVSFIGFIENIETEKKALPPRLMQIHDEIYKYVHAGDPTPFKTFRHNEYLITVGKFGCLEDTAPVEKMLEDEIVITHEVQQMAAIWKQRGALLFGLSDKPREASLPTAEQTLQGFQPLHRAITHSVGE